MKPLGLTDAQLDLVGINAQRRVPLAWRDRFLPTVRDQLLPLDEVTDADVEATFTSALEMART